MQNSQNSGMVSWGTLTAGIAMGAGSVLIPRAVLAWARHASQGEGGVLNVQARLLKPERLFALGAGIEPIVGDSIPPVGSRALHRVPSESPGPGLDARTERMAPGMPLPIDLADSEPQTWRNWDAADESFGIDNRSGPSQTLSAARNSRVAGNHGRESARQGAAGFHGGAGKGAREQPRRLFGRPLSRIRVSRPEKPATNVSRLALKGREYRSPPGKIRIQAAAFRPGLRSGARERGKGRSRGPAARSIPRRRVGRSTLHGRKGSRAKPLRRKPISHRPHPMPRRSGRPLSARSAQPRLLGDNRVAAPHVNPPSEKRNPWRSPEGRRLGAEHPELVPGRNFPGVLRELKPPQEAGGLDHASGLWGTTLGGAWLWLERARDGWRAWGGPGQGASLWQHGRWWVPAHGAWFWVRDGVPLGLPAYERLLGAGLLPGQGARLVYSADGARAAARVPGRATVIFDCLTGEILFLERPDRGVG